MTKAPTPAVHYREAERLLEPSENGEPPTTNTLLTALVHATLALAPLDYATTIQIRRK